MRDDWQSEVTLPHGKARQADSNSQAVGRSEPA